MNEPSHRDEWNRIKSHDSVVLKISASLDEARHLLIKCKTANIPEGSFGTIISLSSDKSERSKSASGSDKCQLICNSSLLLSFRVEKINKITCLVLYCPRSSALAFLLFWASFWTARGWEKVQTLLSQRGHISICGITFLIWGDKFCVQNFDNSPEYDIKTIGVLRKKKGFIKLDISKSFFFQMRNESWDRIAITIYSWFQLAGKVFQARAEWVSRLATWR